MSTNAFEALLTPETLRARREAELAAANKEEPNFWLRQSNMAGLQFRNALRKRGIGLSDRDTQAAYNQSVLQGAAQSAAAMVKDGMDPAEARVMVLENAGREFVKNGNYAEADEVLAQASSIRSQMLEREKLKTDIEYTKGAKTALAGANADAATRNAEARVANAQAALDRAGSTQERVDAQNELDLAAADLKRRTDPNLRGTGGKGGPGIPGSKVASYRDQMAGWLGFARKATQLVDVIVRAQRTGTLTAGKLAPVLQEISGLMGVTPASANQILAGQKEDSKAAYAAAAPEIARAANRLGVNFVLFNSLVIDLAYAHARTNDPTGRISDRDLAAAIQALGASGDAEAMAANLRRLLSDGWFATKKGFEFNKLNNDSEPAWTEGLQRATELGLEKAPPPPKVTPAPEGRKETAAERAARMGIK